MRDNRIFRNFETFEIMEREWLSYSIGEAHSLTLGGLGDAGITCGGDS